MQAEVAILGDPSVCAILTRRGYVLENFENVLGLPLPAANLPNIGTGIGVRVADAMDHEAWLDVIVVGFGSPGEQGFRRTRSSRAR